MGRYGGDRSPSRLARALFFHPIMKSEANCSGPRSRGRYTEPRPLATAAAVPDPGVEHGDAAVLHDLRNLLLVVYGRSLEARSLVSPEDQLTLVLDELHTAIECAVGIAKAHLQKVERTSLSRLLSDCAPLMRRALPDSVRVEIDTRAKGDLWVLCDRIALTRALLNLCTNAGSAMTPGGCLSVTLDIRALFGMQSAYPRPIGPGRYASVVVSDTGEGMSEEQLALAFELGHSSRSGPDRGFGLAIAADVMGRHGGGIRASSKPGGGSAFEFLVPLDPHQAIREGG